MKVNNPLFTGLVLGILATAVLSQNTQPTSNTNAAPTTPPTTAPKSSSSTSADPPTSEKSTTSTSASSTKTSAPPVVITGGVPATSGESVPGLSSNKPPALPTLTGGFGVSFPVVTVPPTANAPFMQKSSLPEGTVFIAVGSALAFFALAVIAWRCLVAWSLHRSVKRAATHVNISDTKNPMLRPPPGGGSGGFYAGTGPGSQLSLEHIATTPRTATRPDGRQMTPNSSLFFSPTAGAGTTAGERRSSYLPAGYYASGARDSQVMMQGPANTSHTHLQTQSISSRYGGRNVGISPPGSPLMGPTGPAVRGASGNGPPQLKASESHTSLSLPPTGRAPSAYLEDLFESHRQQPGPQNGRY
ncbi:hypothetical protein Q9L58_003295 [Maublancomyces gigas]|uniref:Uncharacterized protein n=1 Tax=Discina gigas TaxID=1032678 RepID=A0ABR3GPK6_9PEZI